MRFLLRILLFLVVISVLGLWTAMLSRLYSQYTAEHIEEPKYSSIPSDTFLHVQQLRKKKLRHFCLWNANLIGIDKRNNAEQLLASMTVSVKLQMVYCRTRGPGMDTWEHFLQEIEGRADITLETPVVSQQNTTATPSQLKYYNLTMLEIILRSYTKVIFIRDPLDRLISTYLQAFAGEITFSQFIDNVLTSGESDDSYRPVIDLCHPCFIRYDYIVMQEVIRDEVYHLMKRLGLPAILPESSAAQSRQTRKWLTENLFRELETPQRKQLVEAFSSDYEAFTFYSSLLWKNASGKIR